MNYRILSIFCLLLMYSLKAAGPQDEEWWKRESSPIPGLDDGTDLSVSPIDWEKALSYFFDDESDPESEEECFPYRVEERSKNRRPHFLEIERKESGVLEQENYACVAIRRDKKSINVRFGDGGYRLVTFKEGIEGFFNGLKVIGEKLFCEGVVSKNSITFQTSVDQVFDQKEPLVDKWEILDSNALVGDSVAAYLELGEMPE